MSSNPSRPRSKPRSEIITAAGFQVRLERRPIKTLRLTVLPPHGEVRIRIPLRTPSSAARALIENKKEWLETQIARLKAAAPSPYLAGCPHLLWGRALPLDIIPVARGCQARPAPDRICVYAAPESGEEEIKVALEKMYRRELDSALSVLLATWSAKIGRAPARVRIRAMRTRWGSCSLPAGNLTFNLELARRPAPLLELVVVHELVHLWERGHGPEFRALMSRHLPDWQQRQRELNRLPIPHSAR